MTATPPKGMAPKGTASKGTAPRGIAVVLSSPSATGKSLLAKRLREEDPNLGFSISVTTRKPRSTEQDGRDYIFTHKANFKQMEQNGEFLESAEVFGNLYGTPKKPVAKALSEGKDLLFDVDWQGGTNLKKSLGEDTVLIFLLPPSALEQEKRMKKRAEDCPATVAQRLKAAAGEIPHWGEYDFVLVNDNFDTCLAQAKTIIAAARLRVHPQRAVIEELVNSLLPHSKPHSKP